MVAQSNFVKEPFIAALRGSLILSADAIAAAQRGLHKVCCTTLPVALAEKDEALAEKDVGRAAQMLEPAKKQGSRASHLQTLFDLIGPRPQTPGAWREPSMWEALQTETKKRNLQTDQPIQSIEAMKSSFSKDLRNMLDFGWPVERAEAFQLLQTSAPALAHALQERSPRYASATYELCSAIYDEHLAQVNRGVHAPAIYKHLKGMYSLSTSDAQWEHIETPDQTGFKGLTCTALVTGNCLPDSFSESGYVRLTDRTCISPAHAGSLTTPHQAWIATFRRCA